MSNIVRFWITGGFDLLFGFVVQGRSRQHEAEGRPANFLVEPESAAATLDVLRKYGVNAIALVSFGKPEGPEAGLLEAIASMAHLREVKVMLKPQIWGPNGYPGTIDVSTAAERDRWFRDYGGLVENAPTGKER